MQFLLLFLLNSATLVLLNEHKTLFTTIIVRYMYFYVLFFTLRYVHSLCSLFFSLSFLSAPLFYYFMCMRFPIFLSLCNFPACHISYFSSLTDYSFYFTSVHDNSLFFLPHSNDSYYFHACHISYFSFLIVCSIYFICMLTVLSLFLLPLRGV